MNKKVQSGFYEGLRIWHLDNGDQILMTEREFQSLNAGELDEDYTFDGVDNDYRGVFSIAETTDDIPDILGFEKI